MACASRCRRTGATSPQDQRDRIALCLNNLSVAANGKAPTLSRSDMEATIWAEAKIPAHALHGKSDAEVTKLFNEVTHAVNTPGAALIKIGDQRILINVAPDGALQSSDTHKLNLFQKVAVALATFGGYAGAVLGDAPELLRALLTKLTGGQPTFGPPYPTTPEARATDEARLHAQFGPAVAALPRALSAVFDKIHALGVSDVDIFRGSHVIVQDGGKLYDQLLALGTPRDSSHYKGHTDQQFEINFPGIGPMLVGHDKAGNTFFQFEGHSETLDPNQHAVDYVKYILSGLNVGPGGTSPHPDSDPIRVGG